MTGAQAVSYYHSLLRFGICPGLDRIVQLCRALGDPQKKLRFVHVAGTNGKGSVCTEIASVLQAAGYSVGLYTSPYVIDFRERIRINGDMIAGEALGDITETVKEAIDRLNADDVYPTEFEAITAAAFLYYAQMKCDVVVLETGLGGTFDATNVIEDPLLCVITSVSMDHMSVLGDTLRKIAAEKSGIIKRACDVATSRTQDRDVLDVLAGKAMNVHAKLRLSDPESAFTVLDSTVDGTDVLYRGQRLHIPFPGEHQKENAALVLLAVEILREKGFHIEDEDVRVGLESAFIPARTEILSKNPWIMLDGCHNDGSTRALSELLDRFFAQKKILCVLGLMADKDREAVFSHLLPLFSHVICVTPSNPRSLPANKLSDIIQAHGASAEPCDDPKGGIDAAFSILHRFDALVICGSLYLAGDVREYVIQKKQQTIITDKSRRNQ